MNRIEELQAKVEAYPDDPFWPHVLGVQLMGVGRWAEAETAFQEALRRNPRHHPTYYQLGLLYEATGRENDAITAFREGARIAADVRDLALLKDFRAKLRIYLGLDE
ncbi:MAG: tetratricopeptide repeat protein [Thermaceae bacterium]|nr:tetratricopeptide repeat protein [Thermaceae bacterium]